MAASRESPLSGNEPPSGGNEPGSTTDSETVSTSSTATRRDQTPTTTSPKAPRCRLTAPAKPCQEKSTNTILRTSVHVRMSARSALCLCTRHESQQNLHSRQPNALIRRIVYLFPNHHDRGIWGISPIRQRRANRRGADGHNDLTTLRDQTGQILGRAMRRRLPRHRGVRNANRPRRRHLLRPSPSRRRAPVGQTLGRDQQAYVKISILPGPRLWARGPRPPDDGSNHDARQRRHSCNNPPTVLREQSHSRQPLLCGGKRR